MEKNLSEADRAIRVVIGIVLLAQCFTGLHTIWGLIGIVPFSTAVLGYCPVYRLLGIRTRPTPTRPTQP